MSVKAHVSSPSPRPQSSSSSEVAPFFDLARDALEAFELTLSSSPRSGDGCFCEEGPSYPFFVPQTPHFDCLAGFGRLHTLQVQSVGFMLGKSDGGLGAGAPGPFSVVTSQTSEWGDHPATDAARTRNSYLVCLSRFRFRHVVCKISCEADCQPWSLPCLFRHCNS